MQCSKYKLINLFISKNYNNEVNFIKRIINKNLIEDLINQHQKPCIFNYSLIILVF